MDPSLSTLAWSGWALWGLFLCIALATTVPRASFIVLGASAALPTIVQKALRFAPPAALAAVVAPDVFVAGGLPTLLNPRVGAALVVVAVCLRFRNPWLPFIGGMATLWTLRGALRAVGI
jgi:branched-subunit amino acid transport protein